MAIESKFRFECDFGSLGLDLIGVDKPVSDSSDFKVFGRNAITQEDCDCPLSDTTGMREATPKEIEIGYRRSIRPRWHEYVSKALRYFGIR